MKALLFCLCLAFPLLLKAQVTPGFVSKFDDLEINNIDILDSELGNYRVFISGENHTYASDNSNIELKLLKYFNAHAGVRNLLLELGFARGYMLDKYINEDSSYYDLLKTNTGYQYLLFYKLLREYNQSLPENRRIHVIGIDVERFPDDAPIVLDNILPKEKAIPESISFSIEVIRSYAKYCKVKYNRDYSGEDDDVVNTSYYKYNFYQFDDEKVIDSMLLDYQKNKVDFNAYLGADSSLFEHLMYSMKEFMLYKSYRKMPQQYIYRERTMFNNLNKLLKDHPDENYFGQFGRCHSSLEELNEECEWWAFSSLAKRINESDFKNQILNIGIFYENSSNEFFETNYYSKDSLNEQLKRYVNKPAFHQNELYEVNLKDSQLSRHFKYILVSKQKTVSVKYVNDFHGNVKMLNFGIGVAGFNFNQLNTSLFGNKDAFESQFITYSIGSSSNSNGFYFDMNYSFNNKQTIFFPGLKYKLSAYRAIWSNGYSPHLSKRFNVSIYGSYGYSRMVLNIENDSMLNSFSPGFSAIKTVKYVNPAFVLGGGIDFRYALSKWFGLFVRGQYLFDVSHKEWRLKDGFLGKRDKQSPATSARHYNVSAGFYFIFEK